MSLYDAIRNRPNGERRLAAAEARYAALRLLRVAFDSSGLSKSELAKRLEVGKSAVGHVLDGNGNVRITTLSDYLHESGMRLHISAEPLRDAAHPESGPSHSYSQVDFDWANATGAWTTRQTFQHGSDDTLLSVRQANVPQEEPVVYRRAHSRAPFTSEELHDTAIA